MTNNSINNIEFDEDSGIAIPNDPSTPGVLIVQGGTSTGGAATNINTKGSGSTVSVCLNNSISQPNTNNTGTTGMYSLGGNIFMHKYGTGNAFLGEAAGNLSLTGTSQTGIGANALQNISSGTHNTAVGQAALYTMTTGNHNTFLGANAGEFLPIGEHNIGIGDSALYGGVTSDPWYCVAIGDNSQANITTGYANTSVGYNSLGGVTSGESNVSVGLNSSLAVTSGSENTVVGHQALLNGVTTSQIVALGSGAGFAYVGAESSNIVIRNDGVVAESNTIRIGTQGGGYAQQNRCFVAGITGVSVSNTAMVTIDTTTGQLGSQAIPLTPITIKKTLTSAQIKNLTAAPFQMVAAQGANTIIVPISIAYKLVYAGSNAFTSGSDLNLSYASGQAAIASFISSGVMDGTANIFGEGAVVTQKFEESAGQIDNQDLVVYNAFGTDFTGNAAGDNTLIITLTYYVATLT